MYCPCPGRSFGSTVETYETYEGSPARSERDGGVVPRGVEIGSGDRCWSTMNTKFRWTALAAQSKSMIKSPDWLKVAQTPCAPFAYVFPTESPITLVALPKLSWFSTVRFSGTTVYFGSFGLAWPNAEASVVIPRHIANVNFITKVFI